MIIGIGTDLIVVQRISTLLSRRGERALQRLFTPDEAAYCERKADPAASLAARFAAKEAFFKALGTGAAQGGDWREVEVVADLGGAPSLRLSGRAAARAAERGVRRLHLSLTHTDELAGAFVVLEG